MIGIPGTGLGGVFYALLVAWMAVRETGLAVLGASDGKRWPKIAWLGTLLAGVILALVVEGWLLQSIAELFGQNVLGFGRYSIASGSAGGVALDALIPALALAPFIILALIVLTLHSTRLALRSKVLVLRAEPVPTAPAPGISAVPVGSMVRGDGSFGAPIDGPDARPETVRLESAA